MSDFADEMKTRTKKFALRVLNNVRSLPEDRPSRIVGDQLLRAGTSVGANYRAACRARSTAEFRSKLGIVEEECDETIYWIEIITGGGLLPAERLQDILEEANEILAIIVTSINTSKRNR